MEKEQQDAEQPAKKRPRLEPSATVTSGTCSTGEGKSKAAYPLSGPSNVLSRVMESVDSKPPPQLEGRGGGELSFVKKQVQTAHNAPHPMVHVKTEPGSTVVTTVTQDRPVASTKEQTPVPVVADVKQEPGLVTSRAPEKLSLRDYRQRQPMVQPARDSHQHPPVREANHTLSSRDTKPSPQQKELKHESVVMPDHLQLKEAKVVVQDLQHSHGHDRLMFTSAQNAADASRKRHHGDNGSDPDKRRHHHHHHSRGSHDGQRVLPESGESRRHSVKGEERECGRLSIGGHDSEKNSPHSPLKLHIKRESSGAHHIRHSSHSSQSSSPLKVKIKRDPETSSMHTATEDDARPPKEKKESLKVRLSLPSATSSSQGDKHSRHKMQDNTAPHQKITILMGAEGGGSSNARVLPSSHNSNGHNDRRRSKHSRGGSHEHHDSQYPGYPSGTSSDASMRRSASSSVMLAGAPPPPPEATASTVNIHYGGGSGGNFHHSGRPLLQSQYSGFSLGDGFLNTLPADIFEPDTPTGAGDLNGLGGFEAPQTPTADNMKQVRAHMQQMMAQHSHKSQSERIHQHHSLHNSSHLPPQQLLYLRDNRFSQPPPLPPPLPPDPNPPPPPPPPPSH
ncbi:hypothetical protein BaRGS_00013090 [Batillaria attramentaria]|uniref:Uncharacterized protein n=1 Tax=Batillaria attramentaria TaxID=370345 RepID=A0ABD0L8Y5_9CAEN